MVKVCSAREIELVQKKLFDIDGLVIAVFYVEGKFYAMEDICTHDGGPVIEGPLNGHEITCPRHGARFDVRTGKPLCMPAFVPIQTFPVEVKDGDIYIDLD